MPKTARGKSIVRLNPVQHGLRTVLPVIRGENAADWEAHRAGILQSLAPAGALEVALAGRVALLLWRLQRVARFETAMIARSQERAAADHAAGEQLLAAYQGRPAIATHPDDLRAETNWLRNRAKLVEAFSTLPDDTPMNVDDAGTLLHVVAVVAIEQDELGALRRFSLPGLPPGADVTARPDWAVPAVRACIAAIAGTVDRCAADLLAGAVEYAWAEAHGARYMLEKAQTRVEAMEAERQLPGKDDLDRILRYEGHLTRQLLHTLHELEALQARRQGSPAPLARIDVSGLQQG